MCLLSTPHLDSFKLKIQFDQYKSVLILCYFQFKEIFINEQNLVKTHTGFFLYSELILCKLDSGSAGFSVRYGIRGIELKRYSGHAASISSIGYVTHTVLYLVLGGCLVPM